MAEISSSNHVVIRTQQTTIESGGWGGIGGVLCSIATLLQKVIPVFVNSNNEQFQSIPKGLICLILTIAWLNPVLSVNPILTLIPYMDSSHQNQKYIFLLNVVLFIHLQWFGVSSSSYSEFSRDVCLHCIIIELDGTRSLGAQSSKNVFE